MEEAKKQLAKKEYQKRYNSAARKWVSSIIALPILLVTSYYLFDRREFLWSSRVRLGMPHQRVRG